MRSTKLINAALLVVVNTMWAAQYAAYKTASDQMGPVTVSAWTFLFAILILLPFLVRERRRGESRPGGHAWNRRDLTGFLIIGVFGLVPASAFLAWGTERSTASNAA